MKSANRPAAVPFASTAALDRFQPWGHIDAPQPPHQFIVVNDGTFRFVFATGGDYFECSGSQGVIQVCDLIQP